MASASARSQSALVDRDDFAERRQGALEFEADLAVLAGEQELHQAPPYCLPTQFL